MTGYEILDNRYSPYKVPMGYELITHETDAWGDILLLEKDHCYVMTFNSVFEQSRMDRQSPIQLLHQYTQTMFLIVAFAQPKHVTLLGLGGGCLLRSLHYVWPDCFFHTIELRPQVYAMARCYFGLPDDKRVQITLEDAALTLHHMPDQSTDLILADMFFADGASPLQSSLNFLQDTYRSLSDSGWLVVNFHSQTQLDSDFFTRVKQLFQTVIVGSSGNGNYILYAGKPSLDALSHYRANLSPWQPQISLQLFHLFDRLIRFR